MSGSKNKCKIVIDCDPGADDAQAILMTLNADHIDIVAITTVFGNAKIENTYLNVLRLLKFCHRSDIPVYKGCDRNLIMEPSKSGADYFGEDGFGDVIIPDVDPVDCCQNPTEHASVALCRLVSENPGEITLIALGCLTNIAVCLKLDPDFGKKLKDCVIMGGNNKAQGNLAPAVEFNFGKDPESAKAVLEGFSALKPYLFTYEVCLKYAASWEWYARYTSCGTKLSKLMEDIDRTAVMSMKNRQSLKYLLYDQFAIAAIIDPSIMKEVKEVYADVELRGEISRGLVVVDWAGKLRRRANVRLVTSLDAEKCKHMMMESVKKF